MVGFGELEMERAGAGCSQAKVREQILVSPCWASEKLISLHHRHPEVETCAGPWAPRGGQHRDNPGVAEAFS